MNKFKSKSININGDNNIIGNIESNTSFENKSEDAILKEVELFEKELNDKKKARIKTNLYFLLFGLIFSIIVVVLEIKTENEFKTNLIISLVGIALPIYAIIQDFYNKSKFEKRIDSNIEERKMFLKEKKY